MGEVLDKNCNLLGSWLELILAQEIKSLEQDGCCCLGGNRSLLCESQMRLPRLLFCPVLTA